MCVPATKPAILIARVDRQVLCLMLQHVYAAEDAMKLFQRATVNRSRTINASNPASLDCHSVLTLRVRRMPPKTPPSKTASLASAAVTPEGASSFVAAAAATAAAAAAAAAGVNSVASGFVSDSLMGITEDAEGGGAEDEAEGRSSYLRFIEIAGRGLAHDVGGLHLLSRVLGQVRTVKFTPCSLKT